MDHTAQPRLGLFLTTNGWPAVSAAAASVLLLATPALAHTGSSAGGFVGGFAHPLFGPDHVVAMVAVGLWGAFLGAPAIWLLPIVFPLIMAFGGVIGIFGIPLLGVETAIALSAVVLGTMVALAARPPLWVAAVLVGAFAIFHGHAHGAEMPVDASGLGYAVGFMLATASLHVMGIGLGLAVGKVGARSQLVLRAGGGVMALAGFALLGGYL